MAQLIILEGNQLRQLSRLIRNQEADAIKNIAFQSELERAQYLRHSRENLETITKLLDDGAEINQKFISDEVRSPIAHDIHYYLVNSVNVALQMVRNYTLRMNYLSKIEQHSMEIIQALEDLDPTNVTNVARLAKEASQYRNGMLEYTRKHQSPVSRNYSRWLKESGKKFEDLIKDYQTRRKFTGAFENLEDEQKVLVYDDIIEASGRGRVAVNNLSKACGAAGIVVLILITGMMVWDIFSSEHVIQTTTHDAVVTVASIGGAMVGEVVGAALPSLLGIQASSLFVMTAGIIGSLAGAFVIGAFVGWLIDRIFNSGGSMPLSTDGHRCYVTPLPDGERLARQIAHQNNPSNSPSSSNLLSENEKME